MYELLAMFIAFVAGTFMVLGVFAAAYIIDLYATLSGDDEPAMHRTDFLDALARIHARLSSEAMSDEVQ